MPSGETRKRVAYRMVQDGDLEQILAFRRECGWGVESAESHWLHPDWPVCIFSITENGQREDIGMGGWLLQDEDGRRASREKRWVTLKSLFISKKYQRKGFGEEALQVLEEGAVTRFGATTLLLDTAAYKRAAAPDNTHQIQNHEMENPVIGWYRRKGYVQYGPVELAYPDSLTTDPTPVLWAVFLRKDVSP